MRTLYDKRTPQAKAVTQYQAITDQTIEELEEFSSWVENDWVQTSELPKSEEDMIIIIQNAIAQYLRQDEKSQALIKAGEQELLAKWSK